MSDESVKMRKENINIDDEKNLKDNLRRSNLLEQFTQLVDENKRLIQYSCLAVSCAGVVIAVRSLRLFKQFQKISDVPEEYFSNNSKIFCVVERLEVTPGGVRLHMTHVPILARQDRSPHCHLPVKVMGVSVHPQYVSHTSSYLTNLENEKVKLTMFGKTQESEEIQGQVMRKQFGLWRQCLGSSLIVKGYGRVASDDFKSSMFNYDLALYQKTLEKNEQYAKDRKLGQWETVEHGSDREVTIFQRIWSSLTRRKIK